MNELNVLAPCDGIATVYSVGVAPETVTAAASYAGSTSGCGLYSKRKRTSAEPPSATEPLKVMLP